MNSTLPTQQPLKGKHLAIFGFPSRKKLQLQDEIKRLGGQVCYAVTSKTNLLVTTPQETSLLTNGNSREVPQSVSSALTLGVPIVSDNFIQICFDDPISARDVTPFLLVDSTGKPTSLTASRTSETLSSSSSSSSAMECDSNEQGASPAVSISEATPTPMEVEGGNNNAPTTVNGTETKQPVAPKVFDISADISSKVWRTANVFISSTFRDMHGERDYLTRRVFPELQERCNALRVQVCPVDLRWGVTEESSRQQALEICLSEVDNCRPFFLGILGERYGWVYDNEEEQYGGLDDLPKFEWLRTMPPKCSTTHLEMEYGVLQNPSASQAVLLLRNPDFLGDVSYQCISDFEPENDHAKKMMLLLKKRIRERCSPSSIYEYPCRWKGVVDGKPMVEGLEEFGNFALEQLWQGIQAEFGSIKTSLTSSSVGPRGALDDLAASNAYHERFMELQAAHFVGRSTLLKEIQDSVSVHPLTVIAGEPGSGKSALVSTFVKNCIIAEKNTNPDDMFPIPKSETKKVIYHFIGAAPGSTDARRMLSRVCKEINQGCFENEYEIPEDFTQLKDTFTNLLKAVAEKDDSFSGVPQVLLIFDALNQLDDTFQALDLDWLPAVLPQSPRVKIVVSVLPGYSYDILCKRSDANTVTVGGLSYDDKQELVEKKLAEYRKKLDEKQMKLLLSKPDSRKPLYLFVACEELRVFGVYEKLQERLERMAGTVPELFGEVLARLEEDHGWGLVQEALCLLTCARGGLLEQELLNILGEGKPLPRSIWAGLYLSLKPYLRPPGEDGQSVLDFFHRQLAKAIRSRYLNSKDVELRTHRQLAHFFLTKADPAEDQSWANSTYIRSFNELPYHQMKSEQWNDLERTLTDLGFIEIKCTHGLTFELVFDYLTSLECKDKGFKPSRAFKEFARYIQSRAYILEYAPYLTFTTAMSLPDRSAPAAAASSRWSNGIEKRPYIQWLQKPQSQHPCLMTLTGHTFPVRDGVFSPNANAKVVASVADDKTVKLWNSRNGAETKTLRGHTESVFALAFSPNGEFLVTVSWDKSWILWNPKTGAEISRQFKAHRSVITTVTFAPDGSTFATGSRDKSVKIWQASYPFSNLHSSTVHKSPVTHCVFSVNGEYLLSSSEDKTIAVLNARKGYSLERQLTGHTKEVVRLAVSPDRKRFASASLDKTAKIWDMSHHQFKELRTLTGHHDGLCSVSFSPNGRYIATSSHDNIILMWDAQEYTVLATLTGHTGSVFTTTFSPDSAYLLTASFDRSLKVWDMRAVKMMPRTNYGHSARILGSAFSESGKYFATAARDKTLKVWDTFTGRDLVTLTGHKSNALDASFAPGNDDIVVSVSRDSTVKVWAWRKRKELYSAVAHKGRANSCDYSPTGERIITGGDDKLVKIWSPKLVHEGTLYGHRGVVTVCRFSPDGKKIASGSEDFTVKLWDAVTRAKLGTFSRHQSIVNCLAFSPSSTALVVGCDDGRAYEWDALNGKLLTVLKGHTSQLRACAYSFDGKHLVTGSTDSQIIYWSTEPETKGHRVCSFACLSRVTTLCSFPLDKTIVVGDGAGGTYILRPIGLDANDL